MIKEIIKQILPSTSVKALQRARQAEVKKETHINRAIQTIRGNTYVEIGVRDGTCFRQINAPRKIGIDPAPAGFGTNLGTGESFFKMTSDEFFSKEAPGLFQTRVIDVALVDGLHEFGQALRDVLNLELFMKSSGVIFMHDCNPLTPEQAGSAHDGVWNGDVWKVAYYVGKYRRDLSLFTFDCDWGVGVLTGFRTVRNQTLPSSQVLNECKLLDYNYLRIHRNRLLHLRDCYYSRYFFFKHKINTTFK